MNGVSVIKEIFKNYDMTFNIPIHVRKKLLNDNKRILIKILRKKNQLNHLLFFVIIVFFILRKYGLFISINKVISITLAGTILASSAVVTSAAYGTYIVISEFYQADEVNSSLKNNRVDKKVSKSKIIANNYNYSILYKDFEINFIDKNRLGKTIADKIFSELKINKKDLYILRNKKVTTRYILFGSIGKQKEKYIIDFRVVDRETSEIKLTKRFISKIENIDYKRIAGEITGSIR